MSERAPFMAFSGTNSRYFAEKICVSLDYPLGKMSITHLVDGEFAVSYEESIRNANVFLVQSTFPNSDNLMELLLMTDTARRTSAESVITAIPYFGWACQDRGDRPHVSIGAKLVADLLSVAGIDRLITMDLHIDQIQGFFNIPADHLYTSTVFLPYIESLKLDNLIIATPDAGGSKCANASSKYLSVPLVLCSRTREKANVVVTIQVISDVQGRNVVLVDSIVDTAGTVTKAANIMMETGARPVRATASHYVASSPASFRVQGSGSTEMVFTGSIPYVKKCAKVEQLSIADIFAETIRRAMTNESTSSQYII